MISLNAWHAGDMYRMLANREHVRSHYYMVDKKWPKGVPPPFLNGKHELVLHGPPEGSILAPVNVDQEVLIHRSLGMDVAAVEERDVTPLHTSDSDSEESEPLVVRLRKPTRPRGGLSRPLDDFIVDDDADVE
jgi:hypothetical protein